MLADILTKFSLPARQHLALAARMMSGQFTYTKNTKNTTTFRINGSDVTWVHRVSPSGSMRLLASQLRSGEC